MTRQRSSYLTVCLQRRVSSGSSTGCLRATPYVPSVLCQFDVLLGAVFRRLCAGVVGGEAHHSTRRLRVLTHDIGQEDRNRGHQGWESAHLVDTSSFEAPLPSFKVASRWQRREMCRSWGHDTLFDTATRRIAGRDGRHATVVTACVKRLAPASANDVARVDAATPQSAFISERMQMIHGDQTLRHDGDVDDRGDVLHLRDLVSTQHVPVCTFKTCPCKPAPRAHVETCVRGAGILGDVLNVHTETC